MSTDLIERLRAALDAAEREARAGTSDVSPDWLLRLIQRDRAMLERHEEFETRCCWCIRWCEEWQNQTVCDRKKNVPWPCPDVTALAEFWLGDPDG